MGRIIFRDEKSEGEHIYSKGFENDFNWRKVYLLAKYLHLEFGYKKQKLISLVSYMCEEDILGFNAVRESENIRRNVVNAMKYGYVLTQPVYITRREVDEILKVKSFYKQKLLIAVLSITKRNSNGNFCVYYPVRNRKKEIEKVVSDIPLIKEMPEFKRVSKSFIRKDIFNLVRSGELEKTGDGFVVPRFVDDTSDVVFSVLNDFQAKSIVSQYVKMFGDKKSFCEDCGSEFIKNSGSHKYCDNCSQNKTKQKHRKYNQKRRLTTNRGQNV